MAPFVLLTAFLGLVYAGPLSLRSEIESRQSQQVNVAADVTNAQFQSFQNPSTLRAYLRSRGINYNLNYNQLSAEVTQINQYFSQKAAQSTTTSSSGQFNTLDDSQILTNTQSTSLKGGPSYTNGTSSANATIVEAITYSNGNASTAFGAIQKTTTVSSTSSSGKSNSTATVTGTSSLVQILTNATVDGASDAESVNGGQQDALTAGSCAARATGASARSSILTTFTVPVNATGPSGIASVAKSFCEAGVSALSGGTGTSSSGTQAALTDGGVFATVTCNGRTTTNATPNIVFSMRLQGTYSNQNGFAGTFTGSRNSSAGISCS